MAIVMGAPSERSMTATYWFLSASLGTSAALDHGFPPGSAAPAVSRRCTDARVRPADRLRRDVVLGNVGIGGFHQQREIDFPPQEIGIALRMRLVEDTQSNLRVLGDQLVDQLPALLDVLRVERSADAQVVVAYFPGGTDRRGRFRHHAPGVCERKSRPSAVSSTRRLLRQNRANPSRRSSSRDSGGQRRLGNIQELGGAGEGQLIRDGDEDAVGGRVEVH